MMLWVESERGRERDSQSVNSSRRSQQVERRQYHAGYMRRSKVLALNFAFGVGQSVTSLYIHPNFMNCSSGEEGGACLYLAADGTLKNTTWRSITVVF